MLTCGFIQTIIQSPVSDAFLSSVREGMEGAVRAMPIIARGRMMRVLRHSSCPVSELVHCTMKRRELLVNIIFVTLILTYDVSNLYTIGRTVVACGAQGHLLAMTLAWGRASDSPK